MKQRTIPMKTRTQRILLASVTAAVLVGASVSAMARGGNDGCDGPRGDMSGPRMEKMQQRMTEHHAKRQAELKAKLKLSPNQEAAWTTFAAATQPPMMDPKNRPDPAEMAKLTTPERIEKMQVLKAVRDTHMTHMADATKAFYASLSPEQQKVFDQETVRGPRGEGRMEGRAQGRGDHHGKGPGMMNN
jgi:hypothetical protein